MLNTTGAVEGNKLIVYAYANNNLVGADPQQVEAYYAMSNMFYHLYHNGDKRTEEMRTLYSMDNKEAKEALRKFDELTGDSLTAVDRAGAKDADTDKKEHKEKKKRFWEK